MLSIYFKDDPDTLLLAISFLLESVEKSMLVNGVIENWILIMDVDNLSVFRIPIKAISRIVEATSTYFCTRMEHMFLINPSFVLKTGWNLITSNAHHLYKPTQLRPPAARNTKQNSVYHTAGIGSHGGENPSQSTPAKIRWSAAEHG